MKINSTLAFDLTDKGLIPDSLIRKGIQALLSERLDEIMANDNQAAAEQTQQFIMHMNHSVIAPLPEKANEQHYELPADFFIAVLGSHLKYSCGYWTKDTASLDEAEHNALLLSCRHAQLEDGMDILELGCGWGSLSLFMAQQYPNSSITAVSNSNSQGLFIRNQAARLGLDNIEIITADMNDFHTDRQYDRVVSVEMFEHMRNYQQLYARVANWLNPGGKFFKHIFVHRNTPYSFDDNQEDDWMSRHFFSGGMMPSDDLPLFFQSHLKIEQRWRWDGRHYQKTCNNWLYNMDASKQSLMPQFEKTYGHWSAAIWWQRWRIFFMACAELFGYQNGQQWWVSHYLFSKR